MSKFAFAIVSLLLVAFPSFADPGWILTVSDFTTTPGALDELTNSTVKITPVGAPQPLTKSLDDVIDIRRSTSPATNGAFILALLSGDKIPGEPVELKGKQILWNNPTLGQISIPLNQCAGFVKSTLSTILLEGPSDLDKAQLANGDWASGILSALTASQLTLEVNGSATPLPIANIQILKLGQTTQPKPLEGRAFKLLLDSGATLTTADFSFSNNSIKFSYHGQPFTAPASKLFSAEHLNGPVSWLSSREPDKIVQKPFFSSQPKPTRFDALLGDRPFTDAPLPLKFGSFTFSRGIGVWSYSSIQYALPKGYSAFRTRYALTPDAGDLADVTVRVKIDGQTVHEATHVRPGPVGEPILIPLPKNAKTLTLEVDYGDNYDTQDRFAWLEPALVREK